MQSARRSLHPDVLSAANAETTLHRKARSRPQHRGAHGREWLLIVDQAQCSWWWIAVASFDQQLQVRSEMQLLRGEGILEDFDDWGRKSG